MRPKTTGTIPLSIRNFPVDLKETLQELAKKNHRSLTQEIVYALELYVQREQSKPPK